MMTPKRPHLLASLRFFRYGFLLCLVPMVQALFRFDMQGLLIALWQDADVYKRQVQVFLLFQKKRCNFVSQYAGARVCGLRGFKAVPVNFAGFCNHHKGLRVNALGGAFFTL